MAYEVKIGISNKHLHLSEEHIEILFGKGHQLTRPNRWYSRDSLPAKKRLTSLDQRELSKGSEYWTCQKRNTGRAAMTDARTIGISAPVRESGKLEGTPGCKLIGPCGEVEIDHGVIVALRHVHPQRRAGC